MIERVSLTTAALSQVSMSKVGKPSWNTQWTNNYNGVNSEATSNVWRPEKDFDVECEFYNLIKEGITNGSLIGMSTEGGTSSAPVFVYLRSDGVRISALINGGATSQRIAHSPARTGLNYLRISKIDNILEFNLNGEIKTAPVGENDLYSIKFLGNSADLRNAFKGQISNIKLIDKFNKSNSRFFPGVIKSFVDNEASSVSIPFSAEMVDEWGKDAVIGAYEGDPVTDQSYSVAVEMQANVTYQIVIKGTGNLGKIACGIGGVLGYAYRSSITLNRDFSGRVSFRMDADGITMTETSIVYNTNFKLKNFGSAEPSAPLLGDREAYLMNYTGVNGKRGIQPETNRLAIRDFDLAINDLMVSSGIAIKIIATINSTDWSFDKLGNENQKIQYAFQYPNTFQIIKPTDPDYGDYA